MGSSLNGTGVTFSNGSTQSVAWPGNTGTVTSVATGNGLTGGTITGSGTISLDYYAGTTQNNTSYPIGSYVFCNVYSAAPGMVNSSSTISTWNSTGNLGASFQVGTGVNWISLAGTWRNRGASPGCGVQVPAMYQRTA